MKYSLEFLRGMHGAPAEAADYIEELEAENDRLREALERAEAVVEAAKQMIVEMPQVRIYPSDETWKKMREAIRCYEEGEEGVTLGRN